jgi:hypothetical protein
VNDAVLVCFVYGQGLVVLPLLLCMVEANDATNFRRTQPGSIGMQELVEVPPIRLNWKFHISVLPCSHLVMDIVRRSGLVKPADKCHVVPPRGLFNPKLPRYPFVQKGWELIELLVTAEKTIPERSAFLKPLAKIHWARRILLAPAWVKVCRVGHVTGGKSTTSDHQPISRKKTWREQPSCAKFSSQGAQQETLLA